MPKRPLLPVWEKGAGGMRGNRASERPNAPTPALGARTPKRPLLPVWEKGVGGMRGNRASERPNAPCAGVGHQNAQTPPSPRVGEGGRGDEGQKARECSTPRIASRTIPLRGECSSPSVRILHLCGATESPPGAPGALSGTGRSGQEGAEPPILRCWKLPRYALSIIIIMGAAPVCDVNPPYLDERR